MAKQPTSRGGTTKVRFLMLEAEGAESDLTQIFAAIQSAVKPSATVVQQRVASSTAPQVLIADSSQDEPSLEESEEDALVVAESPKRVRAKSARKPTTPEVLPLDDDATTSLKEFADRHGGAESDVDRYLVIAAWYKELRDTPAVTTAHIYTGYRTIDWSAGIEDFGAILRYLKKQKLMGSGNRGEYLINHLGLNKVKKLMSGG